MRKNQGKSIRVYHKTNLDFTDFMLFWVLASESWKWVGSIGFKKIFKQN
jgi:hypothetical protein